MTTDIRVTALQPFNPVMVHLFGTGMIVECLMQEGTTEHQRLVKVEASCSAQAFRQEGNKPSTLSFPGLLKKNWTENRRACITEGTDLLIVNSHEEQVVLLYLWWILLMEC
ncbi:hypothetical protein ILYODFUR_024004 [Ilyodon furcidens]|uniref:Uncharacterized protein n=1 Tax=Ilyodon furcidens TaxID=33524 RepID=A0ABV0UUN9_9TELE